MNITVTEHVNIQVTVFQLEGRIHLGNATEMREKAQKEFDRGARNVILELSGIQSLTSEGLRSIHFIHNLFTENTGQSGEITKSANVKLVNPSSDIRRILNVSGFDLFLDIFDNTQDALESF